MKKTTYYTAWVPRDYSENPEERAEVAINEARENMRTYVIPAQWRIVWDRGDYVRVARDSRK